MALPKIVWGLVKWKKSKITRLKFIFEYSVLYENVILF